VVIGASTTIAEYMLPAILGEFKRAHPDVSVQLRVSNTEGVVHMVEKNEIELGIVEGAVNNKQLVVEACRVDELVAIVGNHHPLANEESVSCETLLRHPYLSREAASGTRSVFADYLATHGYSEADLQNAMEMGSTESIKGAVEAGMGISVVSTATIEKECKLQTLSAIPLDPPLQRHFSFVRTRQKFCTRLMDELYEFARGYCLDNGGLPDAEH